MTTSVRATQSKPSSAFGTSVAPKDASQVGRFLYALLNNKLSVIKSMSAADKDAAKVKAIELAKHLMNFYNALDDYEPIQVPKEYLKKVKAYRRTRTKKAKKAVK